MLLDLANCSVGAAAWRRRFLDGAAECQRAQVGAHPKAFTLRLRCDRRVFFLGQPDLDRQLAGRCSSLLANAWTLYVQLPIHATVRVLGRLSSPCSDGGEAP